MVAQTNAHIHESFDVSSKKEMGRVIRLRQERVKPADVSCRRQVLLFQVTEDFAEK